MSISARPDPAPEVPVPELELEELVVADDMPIGRAAPELPMEADVADVLDQRRELDDTDDFDLEVFDATD